VSSSSSKGVPDSAASASRARESHSSTAGDCTGVLLVGGASTRFGSPKALAQFGGETLAERGWRTLGEACAERIAVGKRGELELPFDVVDDGTELRAPLAGIVAGLREARNDVCVFLPVDAPLVTAEILRALGDACREAARPNASPAPCAIARAARAKVEARLRGDDLSLAGALRALDTAYVDLDESFLVDTDTPDELRAAARSAAGRGR
jgi:molybdopterin-guanine dinucleotide biosynthesis protein A